MISTNAIIEKRISRWLGYSLGIIIAMLLGGILLTAIITFFGDVTWLVDFIYRRIFWCVVAAIFALAWTLGKIFLIRGFIPLWRRIFPSVFNRRLSYSFWLIFLPIAGEIYLTLLLLRLSVKRSIATLFLALAITAGLFLALYYPQKWSIFFESPFGLWMFAEIMCDEVNFDGSLILFNALAWGFFGGGLLLLIFILADCQVTRRLKKIVIFTATLAILFLALNFYAIYHLEAKLAQAQNALTALDIPFTENNIKALMRLSPPANAEWTKLLDEQEKNWDNSRLSKLTNIEAEQETDAGEKLDFAEATKIFVKKLEAHSDLTAELDALFSTAPIKYALDLDKKLIEISNSRPLTALMSVTKWYASRLTVAQVNGDRQEFTRLYRLLNNVAITAADEAFLIGALVAIGVEGIKNSAVNKIIGAGILTANDFDEIKNEMAITEKRITATMLRGLLWEVAFFDFYTPLRQEIRRSYCAIIYGFVTNDHILWSDFWRDLFTDINAYSVTPSTTEKNIALFAHEHLKKLCGEPHKNKSFLGVEMAMFGRAWQMVLLSSSQARMVAIACLIEKFRLTNGRLPADLNELNTPLPLDIFSGENFKYLYGEIPVYANNGEVSEKINGYKLYSIGVNQIDDGGTPKYLDLDNTSLNADIVLNFAVK